MTLQQLYYFQKTAEYSHITHAAKNLLISQPSLTISLNNLENELGVNLFEKNGRGISITKDGKLFLNHVNNILQAVKNAELEMKQLSLQEQSNINIAYIHPLADIFIPNLLEEFINNEACTNVSINSLEMTTHTIEDFLMKDLCDIGLCSEIINSDEITQIQIIEQPLILIANKNHPLAKRIEKNPDLILSPEEILSYPFITYFTESSMMEPIKKYLDTYNLNPNVCHHTYSEHAISALVEKGLGIGIIARIDDLNWNKLVEIPLTGLVQKRSIYLTYRTYRKQRPLVERLIQYILLHKKERGL